MALTLNQSSAKIFRITHRANLPWILDNGLHARNGTLQDPHFRNIGLPDLIDRRSRRTVPVAPGGTLHDYVPFYFTPFSIMMFNICTGHGVAPVPRQDILILVSTLHHVAAAGVRFIFTNQHAYPEMAEYFTRTENLNRIDWSLLQSRDFRHDSEDPAKKERYQAEALLWKHVPLSAIQGVCCFDQQVLGDIQHQIQQRGIDFKAAAQPQWYF